MDYLTIGLILFLIGNVIYLERRVSEIATKIKYILKELEEEK